MANNQLNDAVNLLTTTTGSLEVVRLNVTRDLVWLLPVSLLAQPRALEAPPESVRALDLSRYFDPAEMATHWVAILDETGSYAIGVQGMGQPQKQRISDLPDFEPAAALPANSQDVLMVSQWVQFEGHPAIVPDLEKLEQLVRQSR